MAVLAVLAVNSSAGEVKITVEASRRVERSQTLESTRGLLESDLRREAVRKAPSIIEWDRELRDDRYAEVTRELSAAVVKLEGLSESIEKGADGSLRMWLRGRAIVNDDAMEAWSAKLREVEALRGELSDIRRMAESNHRIKREAPKVPAHTSVRLRVGDAQDLGEVAEALGASRIKQWRQELMELLRATPIQVGRVSVDRSPGSKWTGFATELAWRIEGWGGFQGFLGEGFPFAKDSSRRGVRYITHEEGARSDWQLSSQMMATRVDLEVSFGSVAKRVPVAYPAKSVGTWGGLSCVKEYGHEGLVDHLREHYAGWCVVEEAATGRGGETGGPDVAKAAKVWVAAEGLTQATGPSTTWLIRWKDGSVDRVPAVQIGLTAGTKVPG